MKIAILVSGFPPHFIGGAETQAHGMAKALSKAGHDVTVLTRAVPGASETEKREGFLIKRFKVSKYPILRLISHIRSSLREIGKLRPDLLVCIMARPNGFVGSIAKKKFGVKYVTWLRSSYTDFARGRFINRYLSSNAISNADITIAQTNIVRKEVLQDFPNKKVMVIPNAVELGRERAHGSCIVFVGNLIPRKGLHNLIAAMKMLDETPRLIIVGDGPEKATLKKIALGLDVDFVGRVMPKDVKKHLIKGKIFVLPSVSGKGEGFPNVILEAMSVGLPVIATKVAGIPEIIDNGRTGYLVDENNPMQIAKYIKLLNKNEKKRKKMCKECLAEVKKYSWSCLVKKIEKLWDEIKCV